MVSDPVEAAQTSDPEVNDLYSEGYNRGYAQGWEQGYSTAERESLEGTQDAYQDGVQSGVLKALDALQRVYKRLEKGGELRRGDVEALMDEIRSKCAP